MAHDERSARYLHAFQRLVEMAPGGGPDGANSLFLAPSGQAVPMPASRRSLPYPPREPMSVHADFAAGPPRPASGVTAENGGAPVECAPEGLDYRGAFLCAPLAVMAVDAWGRVSAANPACRHVWHAPAGSLIDAPFLSLVW